MKSQFWVQNLLLPIKKFLSFAQPSRQECQTAVAIYSVFLGERRLDTDWSRLPEDRLHLFLLVFLLCVDNKIKIEKHSHVKMLLQMNSGLPASGM